MSYWDSRCDFAELLGKTLTSAEEQGDEIVFETADGVRYTQYHSQDCCESVRVESIIGDLADLIGSPILQAEEVTSGEHPEGYVSGYDDSFTWTFYKLATIKGSVTIRWLGESSGYYSESVDLRKEAIEPEVVEPPAATLPAPKPITADTALGRAVFWLAALIAEAEIEPDETTVRIRLNKAGETIGTQEINLGDDLRAFAALGAPSDIFDEAAR